MQIYKLNCLMGAGRVFRNVRALAAGLLAWTAFSTLAGPVVTTLSGGPTASNPSYFGFANGSTATNAQFHTPVGLALDSTGGLLFVADQDNNAIRRIDLGGDLTITFTNNGIINKPVGVVLDGGNNVYVLNHGNGNNGSVLQFDPFAHLVSVMASGLTNATAIAIDLQTNLYVTVRGNTVMQIAPDGTQTNILTVTNAGTLLKGIAVMTGGYVAVCDAGRNGILVVNPTTATFTNLTGFNGVGDQFGTRSDAQFNGPYGISAAGNGFLVVADTGNNRVKIVDGEGTVTNLYGVASSFWVTGPGTFPGWWDGTVCPGDINYNTYGCVEARQPSGVLFASDGSVYATEDYYHIIRKVTGAGLPPIPPPPPPVPTPRIGWVDFILNQFNDLVSVLRTNQPFVFNNDVIIAIDGTDGTETRFTTGPTPTGVDTIPNPSATVGASAPTYHDGFFPVQVPPSLIPPQPDVIIKAIGVATGRKSSLVAGARFQFKTANPFILGVNGAFFTVTNATLGAKMYYTIDGTDPTNGPPSLGPIFSGASLSFVVQSNLTFKIRGFRDSYQPSDIVTTIFDTKSFIPDSISFGFAGGEASSDFVASPGQLFYSPVTLSIIPGIRMYSLQFNLTVTNSGPNPGPAVAGGAYNFESFLEKPRPDLPSVFIRIPPAMFLQHLGTNLPPPPPPDPPPPGSVFVYNNSYFTDLRFVDAAVGLLGVGWLERNWSLGTNLYNTQQQDLIKYSQPHDTVFLEDNGNIVLGGYAFLVPGTATNSQTYQIQIGRPSATSDGVGAPGSSVFIATPTDGSLSNGAANSIKIVTVGQRKYVAGDCAPFRWFNAGDFGNNILDNSDVEQVFQTAIYGLNPPPPGSDFFDSMDSCGAVYVDNGNGYLEFGNLVPDVDVLFDGNDTSINQVAFGDGVLDVCDVYVTFRRSLDPTLTLFRRFWTNGVRAAEFFSNAPPASVTPRPKRAYTGIMPSVNFASSDVLATPGQTVQVPITAQVFGTNPLRVAALNLTVSPLDGSPALTSAIQFSPNPALGVPTMASSISAGNYSAAWLDSRITGLSGNAVLGMLTVTIPANASASSAYAVHFDHASGSPNGIATFSKKTMTGLITLSDRSASSFNDGIPDSWRLRYFGSIYNLLSQAGADADGDGATNLQEYLAGTDPTDPKSCLKVSTDQGAKTQAQDCVIRWPSVSGKTYVIERSSTVFSPSWIAVSTNIGTGTDMEIHDAAGGNVRFYRVRAQ